MKNNVHRKQKAAKEGLEEGEKYREALAKKSRPCEKLDSPEIDWKNKTWKEKVGRNKDMDSLFILNQMETKKRQRTPTHRESSLWGA